MPRGTVLIIEEDRGTRDAIQRAFVRRGWEVAMCVTESEGLDLLDAFEPDAVIASWDQLERTGAQFLGAVRARAAGARVSLLIEPGSMAARFLAGLKPDLVFRKPVDADDVYEAFEALLVGGSAALGSQVKGRGAGSLKRA
jgi:ActR/RegA family two-component response regulator